MIFFLSGESVLLVLGGLFSCVVYHLTEGFPRHSCPEDVRYSSITRCVLMAILCSELEMNRGTESVSNQSTHLFIWLNEQVVLATECNRCGPVDQEQPSTCRVRRVIIVSPKTCHLSAFVMLAAYLQRNKQRFEKRASAQHSTCASWRQ
jgi:hypothetical protein